MKAVSPLVAGVLLILFTVAVASLVVPFASDIAGTVGRSSQNQAQDLGTASNRGLEITQIRYDGSNLSGSFQNTGTGNLTNFSVIAEGQQVSRKKIAAELKSEEYSTYYFEGVSDAKNVRVVAENAGIKDEEPVGGGDKTTSSQVNAYSEQIVFGGGDGGGEGGEQNIPSTVSFEQAFVYEGPVSDTARGVSADANGNVYVTGNSLRQTQSGGYRDDYYTIKFDSAGSQVWSQRHDGQEGDRLEARDIAVNSDGQVYVTGVLEGPRASNGDYYTVKYGPAGSEAWSDIIKNSNYDIVGGVATDSSGDAYVTGASEKRGNDDYYTVKYGSNGAETWDQRNNFGRNNAAKDIAVDSGNIYVTGASEAGDLNEQYYTVKYDSERNVVWRSKYESGGEDDIATGIAIGPSDSVYVTGYSRRNSDYDYYTVKYDSTGSEVWSQRYDGGAYDVSQDIAVDFKGNAYVTGYSERNDGEDDYYTIKYGNATGTEQWNKTYDSGGYDQAFSVDVTDTGSVYVAGRSSQNNYHIREYSGQ